MRWVKWVVAIGAFLVMIYSCALPQQLAVGRDDEGALPGIYTVNGVDPVGTEYSGTLTIRATNRIDRFDVEWVVTGGIQVGVGTLRGDVLEVVWNEVTNATGQGPATTEYRIEASGEMVGTWLAEGIDTPAVEQVFPEP